MDTTDRGETHRYSLSGEWRRTTSLGLTQVKAYAIDYGLDLFSNFTYFLDDPVNGDQFEQKDDRAIFGASASQRFLTRWFGRDTENVVGLQARWDHIPTVGLYHTRARERLETIRQDDVDQRSGALFFQTSTQWTSKVRTVAGVRGDLYGFDVRSVDPGLSGARTASLASPKLGLVLGPWESTEVYANWGLGFHSNDARGAVQTYDPRTGRPVSPVDPIVRAHGAELGARTLAFKGYQGALAVWGLDIDSELLFVGDAGTTEASRPSRRLGFEWSNVFMPLPWMTLDADLAWSRARFRDDDPAGDRIPGAVEGVASAGDLRPRPRPPVRDAAPALLRPAAPGRGQQRPLERLHDAECARELAGRPRVRGEPGRVQPDGRRGQRHRLLLRVPPARRARGRGVRHPHPPARAPVLPLEPHADLLTAPAALPDPLTGVVRSHAVSLFIRLCAGSLQWRTRTGSAAGC